MKRLIVVAATVAALLSLGAGQAVAGNHSGPEALAKGTGSVTAGTTTPTNINRQICDYTGFCYGQFPVAQQIVDTDTTESFDFDAHSGPQTLTPLDPTDGPQGTMKLTYSSTSTTTVVSTAYTYLCTSSFFIVVGGCPPLNPAGTTTTQNATVTAEVTCLQVVNNTAAIGGHVIRFSGDFTPTRGLLFNGTDNTVAGNQVAPDLFDATFLADAPQECPAPSGGHPIDSGDVYVDQS
jgi:hypothetical protein